MKWTKIIVAAIALMFAMPAYSQSVVNQGQGQATALKPWLVQGKTGSTPIPISSIPPNTAGKTTEVLVLNSASTAVPAAALTSRKGIEVFNNGPNTIYCTIDGTAAVVNKARPIPAGMAWSLAAGPSIAVNCISATADQVTTAATIVSELE